MIAGASPVTLMGLIGVGDTFGTCFGPLYNTCIYYNNHSYTIHVYIIIIVIKYMYIL